jgi:protein AroM
MKKIGMLTIGQSPREDIVSVMRRYLTQEVEILQRGALDDLDLSRMAELQPQAGQPALVTRMRDGTGVQLNREKILPLMQREIHALVKEGAELVTLLCTGDFPELATGRMILRPGRLLHNVIMALAKGIRLGVVMPSASQIPLAQEKWKALDVAITSASPYAEPETRAKAWNRAAEELKERKVDLVYLDCMGMDEKMKKIVHQVTLKPVILASSLVARIIDELMG